MVLLLSRKKRIALIVLVVLLLGVGALFLYYHDPSVGRGIIPCPIYTLTGWYCTGCGTTRALYSILHLDFIQAFHYNAALCLLLPFLGCYFLICGVQFIRYGWVPFHKKLSSKWLFWLAIALVVYGVVRNFIPCLQPMTMI